MNLKDIQEELILDLPERFKKKHLSPKYLGQRFSLCFQHPRMFEKFASELQERLLLKTFEEFKKGSAFASELYKKITSKDIQNNGVKVLPLTQRSDLEITQNKLCHKGKELCFFSVTTGSTTKPLKIFRSKEESVFFSKFSKNIAKHETLRESVEPNRGMTVVLGGGEHGATLSASFGRPVIVQRGGPDGFKRISEYIKYPFESNGLPCKVDKILADGVGGLLQLTDFLKQELTTKDVANIKSVASTGARLVSPREYRELKEYWPGVVELNFSMTEQISSGVYCEYCDGYHFDPISIWEVIHLDANQPIDEGRGRLVVTALYPFSQMMPFIRYLTGDYVNLKKTDCPLGSRVIKPLGRYDRTVEIPLESDPGYRISVGEIFEVLDEFSWVRRDVRKEWYEYFVSDNGYVPIFKLHQLNQNQVELMVEMKYDPNQFSADGDRDLALLYAAFRSYSDELNEAIRSNKLVIKTCASGSILKWSDTIMAGDPVGAYS